MDTGFFGVCSWPALTQRTHCQDNKEQDPKCLLTFLLCLLQMLSVVSVVNVDSFCYVLPLENWCFPVAVF